jgi:hypothetical protein
MSSEVPRIIEDAWEAYGQPGRILGIEELSAYVSTNRVYRLFMEGHPAVIAKVSSYGSYVYFRQDHQLIDQWVSLMRGGRFEGLLARVLRKGEQAFTYRGPDEWVAFYREAKTRGRLPRVLSDPQIVSLGREMAQLHLECAQVREQLNPTWKSLGSDIANLYDALGSKAWREHRGLGPEVELPLKEQCDRFLTEAELLGYHRFPHIPVLIDWNIGNFSVAYDNDGFRLFTRWDYDWFRVEPRTLDFYFCSRVVGQVGDRTEFSYLVDPLFERRFQLFLRTYHSIYPLTENDLLFLKECYRFFILNYVVRSGEHFFSPKIWPRLLKEALEIYLPSLDKHDFRELLPALDSPSAPSAGLQTRSTRWE